MDPTTSVTVITEEQKAFEKQGLFAEALMISNEWSPYMEGIKEAQPDVDDWTLVTTAIVLDNMRKAFAHDIGQDPFDPAFESTQTTNITAFTKYAFELVAAVLPSLIATNFVTMQPMTRRLGEIFFLDYLYGTTKGTFVSGTEMFSSATAGNLEEAYTSEVVPAEVIGTGNNANNPTLADLLILPIRPSDANNPGRVTVRAVTASTLVQLTVTDDGNGALTGDGTGTINYTTGAIAITWAASTENGTDITATYSTNFEANPNNIPELIVQITGKQVEAKQRAIRALWSILASWDLKQAFGIDTDPLVDAAMASEIRQEIDIEILNFILANATAASPAVFDLTPPSPEISFNEHKFTFIDNIIEASGNIFVATRRAYGNFIIAGTNVVNLLRSLTPRFKADLQLQPGPHLIGTLDDQWLIAYNPAYGNDQYVVGYKGDLFLEAGIVYAPYLPVFATKTVMLDDLFSRKGVTTSYALDTVNTLFYSVGTIIRT